MKRKGWKFRNLVIEGGGVRGVALGGTFHVLEQNGILDKIERYAGTSSGAIAAASLACGYNGTEIRDMLLNINFSKFKDTGCLCCGALNLLARLGYHKGDYFLKWMREIIRQKTNSPYTTFKELHIKTGKDLIITATNLTKNRTEYFSRYTQPNMPIAEAVRASMSVPYIFQPFYYGGNYYCDGGLSNNYPLEVFDGNYPYDIDRIDPDSNHNMETLGLKLMAMDEMRNQMITNKEKKITGLSSYSCSILDHMMITIERMSVNHEYWSRTITVPTGNIGMTDFDISKNKIQMIQHMAEVDAHKYILAYRQTNTFE